MKTQLKVNMETGEAEPMFRTQYNFNRDANSQRTGTACPEPTRAQQQFKDEVDINKIMKRFGVTGELPTKIRPVLPDEYDDVTDFASAMNVVRKASEAFMMLPSGVRARFQNNPQVFTEFFANEDNRAEAEKLGLIIPKPKEEPKPAPEPGQVPGKE